MDDPFKIYVDRLRDGQVEKIQEVFSSDFLDVHEKELAFDAKVIVNGEAYLAEDALVLHLDLDAQATMPCSICNESTSVPIEVKGFYHLVPLDEIKSGVYDMQEALREAILLETPQFAECHGGACPQRDVIGKYLRKESLQTKDVEDEGYRPFADLE